VHPDLHAEEPAGLSAVAQDYLKVIWNAQEWSLAKVSTKMLAEKLGVSASTASESIRKLAEQGLVDHEKYGAVTLTESGRRAALAMVRRHRLLEAFLVKELGYSWDEVHDEAEVLEHADPEMLRYFDSIGINLDSRLRVLTRREFAGMISVAVESADGGPTTVDLGSPAAQAIWMVAG
jgi:DtxR family transcriptional regulator, Mn-dependent transcriptional regulator